MDYRSPFEIKQSILEEVQTLQSATVPSGKKARKSGPSSTASGSGGTSSKDDPTMIEKEMPGIENINALNANMKMEEDVQRHIESGQLAAHDVPLYIMNNGSTNQKISIFQRLHKNVRELDDKKLSHLIHGLCESMWVQAPELQCAAPAGLAEVLPLISSAHVLELFVGSKTMLEVSTPDVRQAWVPVMMDCCTYLDPKIILEHVVPLSLKKCEHSEPADQRVFACSLMGRICRRLSAEQVMQSVLSKALAMCQDTNVAVRCEMCTQLGEVARSIGLENAKARVTAELFELLSDEERLVSRAAFSCLIDLIEFFDGPYRREHFFPIIKSYISNPPEEVLSLLIEEFGRFLWKIRSDIQSTEDTTLFATFFRQSSQKSDAEVRRMCAFNLPAVVASLPSSAYTSHIHHCTKALATDSHTPVRRAVAAGFHELVPLLGDRAAQYLCETFTVIAQDPSIEVRTILMKHAPGVLQVFSTQLRNEKDHDAFFLSLVPALLSFDQQCPKDWRKTVMLLDVLTKGHEYYGGQVLYEKFVPTLVRHLKESANIIRDQCAELLMSFTASMRVTANAVDVFNKLYHEVGKSSSCYQRLNYVRVFSFACDHFSRRFLKERMLELILELSRDPVASIRVAVARVAPKIRRVLKNASMPADQSVFDGFQNALQRLQMDDDELVRVAARESADMIEQIDREFSRQQLMKNAPTPVDDLMDKKHEEGEGNLIEAAKEHDKAERRSKLKELLKSEKEKEEQNPRKSGSHTVAHAPVKRISNLSSTGSGSKLHSSGSSVGSSSNFKESASTASSSGVVHSSTSSRATKPASGSTSTTHSSGTMSSSSTSNVRTSLTRR